MLRLIKLTEEYREQLGEMIDEWKYDQEVKKKLCLALGVVCVLAVLIIFFCTYRGNNIGTINGAEWDYLTIEDCKYERVDNAPVSGTDKGHLLGIATNGEKQFYIYTIKGHDDYLYCKWEWEGWIYQLIQ